MSFFNSIFSSRRAIGCGPKPGLEAIKKQEEVVNSIKNKILKGDKSVNSLSLQQAVNALLKAKEQAKKACEAAEIYHCIRGQWVCVQKWMVTYRHKLKTAYDNMTMRYGYSKEEFMNIVGLSDAEMKLLLDMSMNSFFTMPTILSRNQFGILSLGAFGQDVAEVAESAKKEGLVARVEAEKQIADQAAVAKTGIAMSVDKRLRASVFDYNIVHSQEAKDRRIKSINEAAKSSIKRYEKDLDELIEMAKKIRSEKGMNVDLSDKKKKMKEFFKVKQERMAKDKISLIKLYIPSDLAEKQATEQAGKAAAELIKKHKEELEKVETEHEKSLQDLKKEQVDAIKKQDLAHAQSIEVQIERIDAAQIEIKRQKEEFEEQQKVLEDKFNVYKSKQKTMLPLYIGGAVIGTAGLMYLAGRKSKKDIIEDIEE